MDAVKFLEELNRMCVGAHCIDCKLQNPTTGNCYANPASAFKDKRFVVDIVEQWSKDNPVKTRADVFKELFPKSDPFFIEYCSMEGKDVCCLDDACLECQNHYWSEPAPEGFGKGGAK